MTKIDMEALPFRYVRFYNLEEIDPRSFTMMGLNVKPNVANPIGHFGTGLKYAIAVCVRSNIPITIWSGLTRYMFKPKKSKFRGEDINEIKMIRQDFSNVKDLRSFRKASNSKGRPIVDKRGMPKAWVQTLPYTTEYGKDWKLWQVFRELYANTLDEKGYVFSSKLALSLPTSARIKRQRSLELNYDESVCPTPDHTWIEIDSKLFAEIYEYRHNIFLPKGKLKALNVRRIKGELQEPKIEVYDQKSNHLYFRGLRVYDLVKQSDTDPEKTVGKPSRYTYNFNMELSLTEDRTLKYPTITQSYIVDFVVQSRSKTLIEAVVTVTDDEYMESDFNFRDSSYNPSKEFMEVMATLKHKGVKVIPSARSYYTGHYGYEPPAPSIKDKSDIQFLEETDDVVKMLVDFDASEPLGYANKRRFMEVLIECRRRLRSYMKKEANRAKEAKEAKQEEKDQTVADEMGFAIPVPSEPLDPLKGEIPF